MTVIDGGGARVRRPAVVLFMLLGLLLMHGLAMNATGCMGSTGPSAGPVSMASGPGSPMSPGKSERRGLVLTSQRSVTGHGTLCLADQPRTRSLSVGLTSVVVLSAVPLLSRPARRRAPSSRAPPLVSGSALLTRLCIWRT